MIFIDTPRGKVRVIDADCARRPCLHIHWSKYPAATVEVKSGPFKGGNQTTFPLVCVRNEEHGCPHPTPEPRDG